MEFFKKYIEISIGILLLVIISPSLLKGQQIADTLQPYAPHWFIDELLEWSPENDKDAIFNRSFTPLATKYFNSNFKANPHAHAHEANIEILPVFAPTNENPSQGSLDLNYYAFTYWQYCDVMTYWGGSSYEGIILTPTAPVVDAAHRNGVPVYGTVFFPPSVYGGKRDWVYEFVQNENGVFPVADKLIEVANYYGFDGWFINQETGDKGKVKEDESLAKAMQEFMLYYKDKSNLSIQWYDAMLNDGTVRWQHEINDKNKMFFQRGDALVSDQMFLDFRYNKGNLARTNMEVNKLGRNIYDVYGGIDVQTNGYETEVGYRYPQGANFDVLFPEGKPHAASMAFYVPSWTYSTAESITDFYNKESRFWVGENGDPRNTETKHNWKGVAHYVPAKSVVNSIPFVTNFCAGHGEKFFLQGKNITSYTWDKGWNNLTLQDIQPTWRWIIESEGEKLDVMYDFSDAFNGGNCLKIDGESHVENIIPLYSTQLKLNKSSTATIALKKDDNIKLSILFTLENGSEKELVISNSNEKEGDWYIENISLKKMNGSIINRIALKVASKGKSEQLKIGSLGIVNKKKTSISSPKMVQLISKASGQKGTVNIRVSWSDCDSQVYYYRLYKITNGSKIFMGATTANACFLPLVPKQKGEKVQIAVESVGHDFSVSKLSILTINEDSITLNGK